MVTGQPKKVGASPLASEETVIAPFTPIEVPQGQEPTPSTQSTFRPIWAPGAYARLMQAQNKNVVRELVSEKKDRVAPTATSPMTAEHRIPTSDLTEITGIEPADYSNDIAELKLQDFGYLQARSHESNEAPTPSQPTRASLRANEPVSKGLSKRLFSLLNKS